MARIDLPEDRLSEYERVICYYTLPRIAHPVAFWFLVVYAVCLVESVAVILYGLLGDRSGFVRGGLYTFGGIVAFGIVVFVLRAFISEFKLRKALAVARSVPDAIADMEDVPDPFADHVLLRHPLHDLGDLFPCTDGRGKLLYFVESAPQSAWWKVRDAQDNEVLRVRVQATSRSFSLQAAVPSKLVVLAGDEEIAHIHRRFSLTTPTVEVTCLGSEPKQYVLGRGGIFRDKRLVGRVYYLRQSVFLDMQRAEFHDAILGLFVTMT